MTPLPIDLVSSGAEAMLGDQLHLTAERLAPDVEWVWWEAGGTDLRGREAVLAAMRERLDGKVLGQLAEVTQLGDDILVSISPPATAAVWGATATWTRVVVRDGLAVRLISYDSRERALAG